MRKTWFHSLALTLGVTAIPSIASAQYSNGTPGGLAASAFNANAMQPPPGGYSGNRNDMAPQQGQTTLAAYAQNGVVGSGVPGGHVHVPVPAIENSSNNSQTSVTQFGPQGSHPYELIQPAQIAQPAYSAPQTETAQTGVNVGSSFMVSSAPSNGYGSADSCFSQPVACCAPSIVSPKPWIFGVSGLVFSRVDDEYVRLTTNTADGANPTPAPNPYSQSFLSTSDASMQETGGFQFNAGRYFCCGRYAMIGSYWGIYSNPQSATILATDQVNGNLRSNLPILFRDTTGNPQYGIETAAQTAYDWYDGAYAHRILRDQQFQSAELNFFSFALGGGARQAYAVDCCGDKHRIGYGSGAIRSHGHGLHGLHGGHGGGAGSCGTGDCGTGNCGDSCQTNCAPVCSGPTGPCAPWYGAQCSKLRLNMYGGFRWFQFKDSLEYASSSNDADFNGGADDFYYRNGVTNDLLGFQLGSLATWCTGTRLNLFGGGNFGVYGNRISAATFAGTATQTATIFSPNTAFDGRLYDYSSTLNDVALMGEGTLGAGLCICRGWTANAAYRLVGVSGVATAVGQIPRDFARGDQITHINNSNSLLLHGVSLGVNYNF